MKYVICIKFTDHLLQRLLSFPVRIILIRDKYDRDCEPYAAETLDRLQRVYDVTSIDSMQELAEVSVDVMLNISDDVTVISGAEYGIFATGYVRSLLCENSSSHLIYANRSRNKSEMKRSLTECGIKTAALVDERNLIDAQYPIVAKPICGTGSINTSILSDHQDYERMVCEQTFHAAIVSQRWILEERVPGQEYYADVLLIKGEPVFLSVSRYIVPRIDVKNDPRSNGGFVLDPRDRIYASIRPLIGPIADAFGLIDDVAHIEFFVDPVDGKITVGEIARRFAGIVAPETLHHAFGIDIIDLWFAALFNPEAAAIRGGTPYRGIGWLSLTPTESGTICTLPDFTEISSLNSTIALKSSSKIGDKFDSSNPSDWVVLLVLRAPSLPALVDLGKEIYSRFPVNVK